MRLINQYETAKPKVDKIQLKDFCNYHIGKLLYASVWSMFGLSIGQRLRRILAIIACKALRLNNCTDTVESGNLVFEIRFLGEKVRKDNVTIFQNIYEYMKPAKHMCLEKHYQIHFPGIFKRLNQMIQYYAAIHGFSFTERLYLAAQLVLSRGLIELLENERIFQNIKYLLIFQEYDTISSTVIQCAHQHNVQVISPQHGMPMNRHENIDQLFFDGFLCDYKLVWSDFEKEQYLSAGIDASKIFVVGNTKNLGTLQKMTNSVSNLKEVDVFGVLLDCPKIDGAVEANYELLSVAKTLADFERIYCVVKLHPTDNVKRYKKVLDSKWCEVLPSSTSMEEYQMRVSFSLAHITGAIFDLIYSGHYVFQYITVERFPVDLNEIYRFTTSEELLHHIRQWRDNFKMYQMEYKKTMGKYCVLNARERHDAFFKKLFTEEIDYLE